MVGEYIVIGFRLAFGWRPSPGWWGLILAAILHSHPNADRDTAAEVLPDARGIPRDVKVVVPEEGVSGSCALLESSSFLNYKETLRRSFTLRCISVICSIWKQVSVETTAGYYSNTFRDLERLN